MIGTGFNPNIRYNSTDRCGRRVLSMGGSLSSWVWSGKSHGDAYVRKAKSDASVSPTSPLKKALGFIMLGLGTYCGIKAIKSGKTINEAAKNSGVKTLKDKLSASLKINGLKNLGSKIKNWFKK